MKKALWIVSCAPLLETVIALLFLPQRVPLHYSITGSIDRWGSKYGTLILPLIILCASWAMAILARAPEKKAQTAAEEKERAAARSNAKVIGVAGVSTAVLFTVLQGVLLYNAYRVAVPIVGKPPVDISKVTVILLGVLCIVLGNFMTKTRINSVVGVRVSWSMYNDNTWRKSNRFGAFALMIAGVLTLIAAAVISNAVAATITALGLILLASGVTVIYARKVYLLEIEAERRKK